MGATAGAGRSVVLSPVFADADAAATRLTMPTPTKVRIRCLNTYPPCKSAWDFPVDQFTGQTGWRTVSRLATQSSFRGRCADKHTRADQSCALFRHKPGAGLILGLSRTA